MTLEDGFPGAGARDPVFSRVACAILGDQVPRIPKDVRHEGRPHLAELCHEVPKMGDEF